MTLPMFEGDSSVVLEHFGDAGEVGDVCKHADAANVGAQREVARALSDATRRRKRGTMR